VLVSSEFRFRLKPLTECIKCVIVYILVDLWHCYLGERCFSLYKLLGLPTFSIINPIVNNHTWVSIYLHVNVNRLAQKERKTPSRLFVLSPQEYLNNDSYITIYNYIYIYAHLIRKCILVNGVENEVLPSFLIFIIWNRSNCFSLSSKISASIRLAVHRWMGHACHRERNGIHTGWKLEISEIVTRESENRWLDVGIDLALTCFHQQTVLIIVQSTSIDTSILGYTAPIYVSYE